MTFFNSILFTKLAWSIYFNRSPLSSTPLPTNQNDFSQFATSLNNLVTTTKVSNHLLIHSLYYLYLIVNHKSSLQLSSPNATTFHTTSREKLISGLKRKNSTELFHLMTTLLMISNKSHDDSSYTMKTWENLTDMTVPMLKKREIIILKKINYNVFLKDEQYDSWYKQLYSLSLRYELIIESISPRSFPKPLPPVQAYQQQLPQPQPSPLHYINSYPLTPKSPTADLNQSLMMSPSSTMIAPNHSRNSSKRLLDADDYYYSPISSNPLKKLKQNISPMPLSSYCTSNTNYLNQSYLLTPMKSISGFQQPQPVPSFSTGFIEPTILPQPTNILAQPLPQPQAHPLYRLHPQPFIHDVFSYQPITLQQHPKDCSCCALTNMANSYYSSIRNTMVKL